MTNARKFLFETEFAPDGTVLRDPARGEFKRFEVEEVEAEKARAFEAGRNDAVAKMERANAEAIAALAGNAKALLSRLDAMAQSLRAQAAEVAFAAARKIAGEALDAYGEERVLAAMAAAMEALPQGPRLVVRVAKGMEETLRPRLEAAAKERLFEGAIIVRGDESAAAGDVGIEWVDGAVALERAEIEARIAALIEAALAAAARKQTNGDDRSAP